jgi:peptidyl-dipeptidase Dcp
LNGAFTIAENCSNYFQRSFDIDKYHEDVQTFSFDFEGQLVAVFYADFFPRKGKRNGAWMTSYKSQAVKMKSMRPHVSIVCNFTPPTENKTFKLSMK